MQTNILWSGREYYSLENCLVIETGNGAEITSTIIGHYQNKIYRVEYKIRTNSGWATTFLQIDSRHNDINQVIRLEGDGMGNWHFNGRKEQRFKGCMEVDIPLTPFTNTLPIRRMMLHPGQSKEIMVIYCDLLSEQINPVRQHYTCRSSTSYHYENVPTDFEALIQVDEAGLVVDYPSLFVKTAVYQTK